MEPIEPMLRCLAWTLAEYRDLGPVKVGALQREFGSILQALQAPRRRLQAIVRGAPLLDFALGPAGLRAAGEELARAQRLGVHLLVDGGPGYPPNLAEAGGRPPVLYLRGNLEIVQRRLAVAVVGTRACSSTGRDLASQISRRLAEADVVVVSGMAYGIDRHAHEGVLHAATNQGHTVAVLASGVDRLTPAGNRTVGQRVLEAGGAVVSEFPLGLQPRPHLFPRRNRIIAGLSLGVLVVEAGERSGATSTANHAVEQGRQVMAIPGSVTAPQSAGCNALIRAGAHLVRNVEDVVESVSELGDFALELPPATVVRPPGLAGRVVDTLTSGPATLDQLAAALGESPRTVFAALADLELVGTIVRREARFHLA